MKFAPIALMFVAASMPVIAAEAPVAALQDIKLADTALTHKQSERALSLAKKALVALESNTAKPAELTNVTQADWEKRRTLGIGTAHWIAGVAEAGKGDYFSADKDLRAALPALKNDPQMGPATLFYLGLSNYQIGRQTYNKQRILQGATFSEDCAKIQGQYQVQAYNNAKTMRKEAATMP